jgi:prolyl-tRNA editing enzyme YbaK/EbsC (Cys-tRNA(Pro) deacylase)
MDNGLRHSAKKVQDILKQHNLAIKVIEFKALTRTAQEAADTIGCQVGQIAKTLIFKTKNSNKTVCIIASGNNRVDERKIELILGEKIERPDADYVLSHTGFAIGGIPPVGYSLETKPFIDEDLMHYSKIWAAAGTPYAVFSLSPEDLLNITGGTVTNVRK